MEVPCCALHSVLWLKHEHERNPLCCLGKSSWCSQPHGYKVHDVAQTFWLDFGQTIDRSWQRNASVYIYIYIYMCVYIYLFQCVLGRQYHFNFYRMLLGEKTMSNNIHFTWQNLNGTKLDFNSYMKKRKAHSECNHEVFVETITNQLGTELGTKLQYEHIFARLAPHH